jgi:hypothetical protein
MSGMLPFEISHVKSRPEHIYNRKKGSGGRDAVSDFCMLDLCLSTTCILEMINLDIS